MMAVALVSGPCNSSSSNSLDDLITSLPFLALQLVSSILLLCWRTMGCDDSGAAKKSGAVTV